MVSSKSDTSSVVLDDLLMAGCGDRFYYGDERKADGSAAFKIDGDAHAQVYLQLSEDTKQSHWLQTFVKGKGYVDFSWQSKPRSS